MDWQAILRSQVQLSTDRILKAIEDIGTDEAAARPQGLAPILWQVGHVAYYDAVLLQRAGLEPGIPPAYADLFPQGTDGRADLPPLAEVVAWFRTQSGELVSLARSDDTLARRTEGSRMYATVGEGLVYIHHHRGYHLGKIMTLRALLGKPRLT